MKCQFIFFALLIVGVLSEKVSWRELGRERRSVGAESVGGRRLAAPSRGGDGLTPAATTTALRSSSDNKRHRHRKLREDDDEDDDEDDYVDPDDNDETPVEYVSEETSRQGNGFKLVLLPTVLLGSLFTVCMCCRWWKTRKETMAGAAYGQAVDDMLSELDGSQIEAVSISYSDDVQDREDQPPPHHTQVEGKDML